MPNQLKIREIADIGLAGERLEAAQLFMSVNYGEDPNDLEGVAETLIINDSDVSTWYGAFIGEQLVGAVRFTLDDYYARGHDDGEHFTHVIDIATKPESRGQGVATSLLGAVAVAAQQQGQRLIELYTQERRFFEGLGFMRADEEDDFMRSTPTALLAHISQQRKSRLD